MAWLLGIIKIIILLGTLVTIHELGHFLVAKACKVKVHKFAIGFGPKILTKVKGGTEYTLRVIPFGGFVQLEGDDERSDDERAFNRKPLWQRMLIIVAGATVNIVFALIIYFGICMSSNIYVTSTLTKVDDSLPFMAGDKITAIDGRRVVTANHVANMITRSKSDDMIFQVERNGEKIEIPLTIPTRDVGMIGVGFGSSGEIAYVQAGSVAETAGILAGDKLLSVNGIEGLEINEYSDMIKQQANQEVTVVVEREGVSYTYTMIPEATKIRLFNVNYEVVSDLNFWQNTYYAIDETGYYFNETMRAFATLFTGKAENVQMMGPVGIAGEITKTETFADFFYMMAAISLSLGVFNLLPVPGLDGGKFLFLIIEGIRKKPMQEKTEIAWQLAGFAIIIMIAILVTVGDVRKLF